MASVEMKMKMCPFYGQLHELLSEKTNVHPPAGLELGTVQDIEIPKADQPMNGNNFDVVFDDYSEYIYSDDAGQSPPPSHSANHNDIDEIIDSQVPNPIPTPRASGVGQQKYTSPKKQTKQSRIIDAYEAKSKVKIEEVRLEQKKLDFEKEKWTDEKSWRERQMSLEEAREQHRMEMESKAAEHELVKSKQQYELEKLKIEKDVEIQIKLAKIKQGIDV